MSRTLLAGAFAGTVMALADGFQLRFLAEVLILGTAVLGLDILVGVGGLVSLGHAALFGAAAYAVALAAGPLGGELLLLLPLGVATGAGLGALMGLVTARTSHLGLLVLTLLLGQMGYEVALHWRDVTGGADGLRGLPRLALGPWVLEGGRALFAAAAVTAAVALAVARSFVAAPAGLALAGARDQPVRMRALGYGLGGIRVRAMLLAGGVAGAAGTLHPFVNQYMGPQSLHWSLSAAMVVMLVIGGAGSLWGGFLGAGFYLVLQTYLGAYTERWQLCVGLAFVLVVLLLPRGLAGLLARRAAPGA